MDYKFNLLICVKYILVLEIIYLSMSLINYINSISCIKTCSEDMYTLMVFLHNLQEEYFPSIKITNITSGKIHQSRVEGKGMTPSHK